MAWYVDAERVPVNWSVARTVVGNAAFTIWKIQSIQPGQVALTLTSFMDSRVADLLDLTDRDYMPGEAVVLTLANAMRVINAGQYVGVNPLDSAEVRYALAVGAYMVTVFAAAGQPITTAQRDTAIADTSPPPVPPLPALVPTVTTIGGGGAVGDATVADLYTRMNSLQTQVTTSSALDRARGNHTGTQAAATILDLRESVEDITAQLLTAGPGVLINYDDALNRLTITGTGTGTGTGGTTPGGGTTPIDYALAVSTFVSRSPQVALSGFTSNAPIAVFLDPATGVNSVNYSIDGVFERTATAAPYDLKGGSATAALLWAPATNGNHTVSAVVTLTDGSVRALAATFSYTGNVVTAPGGGVPPPVGTATVGLDTDLTPFWDTLPITGGGSVAYDTDGTPYLADLVTAGSPVLADTDGSPYIADTIVIDPGTGGGTTPTTPTTSRIGLDTDLEPYWNAAGITGGGSVLFDVDNEPYYSTALTGVQPAADVDGEPYVLNTLVGGETNTWTSDPWVGSAPWPSTSTTVPTGPGTPTEDPTTSWVGGAAWVGSDPWITTVAPADPTQTPQAYYYNTSSILTAITSATTIDALNTALAPMGTAYGIDVRFWNTTPAGPVAYAAGSDLWTDADMPRARATAANFANEFCKYPPPFVLAANLNGFNFVRDTVAYNGTANYSFAYYFQAHTWLTTPIDATTYAAGQGWAPNAIHHEVFHSFDDTWFGTEDINQQDWSAVNPPGFTYGQAWTQTLDGHPLGFLTQYATTSAGEDVAEVHSWCMRTAAHNQLKAWMVNDAALREKVRLHHAFMAKHSAVMGQTAYYDTITTPAGPVPPPPAAIAWSDVEAWAVTDPWP